MANGGKAMMRQLCFWLCAVALAAPVAAQNAPAPVDPHAGHMMEPQAPAAAPAPNNPNLPPDSAGAPGRLKASPRHQEWVDVQDSSKKIKTFVVYPERRDKAPVVIVIHEIFGLSDWVRGVADQLAHDGYIAIAPDLLSGLGPNGGGSQELGEQGATQAIRNVTVDDTNRMLDAVRTYARTISSSNGKVATIGFCWGGGTSFSYALYQPALDAAISFYGPMPTDPARYANAKAPILGLYGGNDNRVNANIELAKTELGKQKVDYEPHVFDGAGHGFLRQQSGSDQAPGNMKATEQAWPLVLAFLKNHVG
jgi:carboxymethylenebutenolidase